ncbi:MAG: hypothetical protein QXU59_04660 [Pyrobaculum sp.]
MSSLLWESAPLLLVLSCLSLERSRSGGRGVGLCWVSANMLMKRFYLQGMEIKCWAVLGVWGLAAGGLTWAASRGGGGVGLGVRLWGRFCQDVFIYMSW